MLRESQNFFFHLMAKPEVIGRLRKNRAKTLKRFFREEGDRAALRSIPLERLETYRKHVSVGLLGGIESAFPVLRSLVTLEEWNGLLNDFYLRRLTRSPIARHVFQEFAHYLKKYRGPLRKRLPYLEELAEYENLEIRLLYDIDRPVGEALIHDPKSAANPKEYGKLIPVLNPHHALRVYRWPVHRICRGYSTPKQVRPERTVLLVYRDPETLRVRFVEANPLVADLVSKMDSGRSSIGQLLKGLLVKRKPEDAAAFVREGLHAIEFLKSKGVLLGFRRSS